MFGWATSSHLSPWHLSVDEHARSHFQNKGRVLLHLQSNESGTPTFKLWRASRLDDLL